jgi:hypothetical protein
MKCNDYSGMSCASGSSGQFTPSGDFMRWRGRREDMYGTHSDNNQDALELWWARFDGYEYAKDLSIHFDVSIGLFGKDYSGVLPQETWKGAARGDYDARWEATLLNGRNRLHTRIGPNGQPPKVFWRPAHEWNGNWYPWSASNYWLYSTNINGVNREASTKADVKAAWKRFRAIQKRVYPESFICCNVNRTGEGWSATTDNPSGKWTDLYPDPVDVDVYGVDYYNWYNTIFTKAQWDASLLERHSYDTPKGLDAHKAFATQLGLPMSFSEWGGVSTAPGSTVNPDPTASSPGDSPVFIEEFLKWQNANAGTGPGQSLYELYWNVWMAGGDQSGADDDKFHLWSDPTKSQPWGRPIPPVTKMVKSSFAYRNLVHAGL